MKESIQLHGEYLIEICALDGTVKDSVRVRNTLMNVNRNIRSQMLRGAYTGGNDALHIKYFAFGDGTAAVTPADTRLSHEVYRKQVTQLEEISDGVVRSVVSLGAFECNQTIREIGVFCGSAGASANSGTLLSRVAVNIEKNSNITLNIIRTDTCLI